MMMKGLIKAGILAMVFGFALASCETSSPPEMVTVVFDSNGGSSIESQTVNYGGTVSRPTDPEYFDYVFGEWCSNEELTTVYDFSSLVTANITLYAKWIVEIDGFVWVNGGTFTMGSPTAETGRSRNEIQHTVTVRGFYMGKYEVTQELYQLIMKYNPSSFEGTDKLPVEHVSWYDAVEFCNKLSMRDHLRPVYKISERTPDIGYPITSAIVTMDMSKNGYRLPTESEWEYAARGGSDSPYYVYAGSDPVNDIAWHLGNSDRKIHEVGGKNPNALGMYDMSGNVWEWCWDWYGIYASGAQTNPTGASSGSHRIMRGGSWNYPVSFMRSAIREYWPPDTLDGDLGFRLARF